MSGAQVSNNIIVIARKVANLNGWMYFELIRQIIPGSRANLGQKAFLFSPIGEETFFRRLIEKHKAAELLV